MSRAGFPEFGGGFVALLSGIDAAGGKAAARFWVNGRRELSFEQDLFAPVVETGDGDGGEQRLGICN